MKDVSHVVARFMEQYQTDFSIFGSTIFNAVTMLENSFLQVVQDNQLDRLNSKKLKMN